MSKIYRVKNPVAGDYIATSVDEALEFVRTECDEALEEDGESVTIIAEEMDEAALAALPEWP